MHSLKNTVVAVGLLALAFMFYQSSSPQPQGEIGEQQANLSQLDKTSPDSTDLPKTKFEPEPSLPVPDIDIPNRLPKQVIKPDLIKPDLIKPNSTKPNSAKPTNPESIPMLGITSPLTETKKQQNLADAIRNQANSQGNLSGSLRTPSPANGSAAPINPPVQDGSFNKKAGGIANPTPNLPRKLGPMEFADLWARVGLDIEQENFKSALKTLSNSYASNDLNGPQLQRMMPYLDKLAVRVIWSQEPHLEKSDPITAETPLTEIAIRWGISVPLIQKINGLPESKISANPSTLKVIKGPFDIQVDRDGSKMTLYLGELYGCQFDCVGNNLIPGRYKVAMNNGNILLRTNQGQTLMIRGELEPSSFTPQSGIISLADGQLQEVCELLTLDSTVTVK